MLAPRSSHAVLHQDADAPDATGHGGDDPGLDADTIASGFDADTIALHCFCALGLTALALGILDSLGIKVSSNVPCPSAGTGHYTTCEAWQDLRSIMSFAIGALITCCGKQGGGRRAQDGSDAAPSPGAKITCAILL